jgi:tetratricopeptide (TPR) repeat protein
LQLNLSKSGVGISAGIPGMRISSGPSGTHLHLGLPGTGISYRKKLNRDTLADYAGKGSKEEMAAQAADMPALPEPGFFASSQEKNLVAGLEAYYTGNPDEALEYFLEAASKEAGAALLGAYLLHRQDPTDYQAIPLLEQIVQSDDEFPTPLMEKYLADFTIDIAITPLVSADVALDSLAATLLLVELYQAHRRVREAMALLEEVEELAADPALTLSLCDLYVSRELWDAIIERGKDFESEDNITLGIQIYYGIAMLNKGLHTAAIDVFNRALRRKKNRNPAALNAARYWRAVSFQSTGKMSKAQEEFELVYAQDPTFRDVEQRLAVLVES